MCKSHLRLCIPENLGETRSSCRPRNHPRLFVNWLEGPGPPRLRVTVPSVCGEERLWSSSATVPDRKVSGTLEQCLRDSRMNWTPLSFRIPTIPYVNPNVSCIRHRVPNRTVGLGGRGSGRDTTVGILNTLPSSRKHLISICKVRYNCNKGEGEYSLCHRKKKI